MPYRCLCGAERLTEQEARSTREMQAKTAPKRPKARAVIFEGETFTVHLADDRQLTCPVAWSPLLANATAEQRAHYVFVGGGVGIHWPDIDEDLSVRRLMVADGEPY